MKFLTFLLCIFSIVASAQKIEKVKLKSKVLNQEREVWVYVPEDLEYDKSLKCEVVYVFDAQSRELFDVVHSSLQFQKPSGVNFIVVGIISPYIEKIAWSRNTEMLPKANHPETIERYNGYCGKADEFLDFIETELVVYIDKNYPTLLKRLAVGHSNSGTLIMHSMLTKPALFTDYIGLSPNFAYDKQQLVDSMKLYDYRKFPAKKFLFLSNANESNDTGFEGWAEARYEVYGYLKKPFLRAHFQFSIESFNQESHWSSFLKGAQIGLDNYIGYQYYTCSNVRSYWEKLEQDGRLNITADMINGLAYGAMGKSKTAEAFLLIDWAIEKFPQNANVLDSKGEFYQQQKNFEQAKACYAKAIEVLKASKSLLDETSFQNTLNYYQGKLDYVSNQQ